MECTLVLINSGAAVICEDDILRQPGNKMARGCCCVRSLRDQHTFLSFGLVWYGLIQFVSSDNENVRVFREPKIPSG